MLALLWIFAVGALVGFINGFAGGASVLSFPALIAVGLNPVSAAMTNAIGVWAANLGAIAGRFGQAWQLIIKERKAIAFSTLGAIFGSLALALLPVNSFEKVVPILIFAASLTLLLKPKDVTHFAKLKFEELWLSLIGFYAGYFGPGQGIMTIAVFARDVSRSVRDINFNKNVLVAITCIGSNLVYIASGKVNWLDAFDLAFSSAIGGYLGAKLVSRFNRDYYRAGVFLIGIASAVWFASRYWQ
jgi:uncharacterized membrane protein YfcA